MIPLVVLPTAFFMYVCVCVYVFVCVFREIPVGDVKLSDVFRIMEMPATKKVLFC